MTYSFLATSPVAWWGAGLSTLLALVKIWEIWRDRFRVDIGYSFAGLPAIGNKILIRNLGSRTFILAYWELLYCSGKWPFRRFAPLASAEYDAGDRKVEPHTTCTLSFTDAEYFDWGVASLKGRSIYIRVNVAGRRPLVRLVYRP